jgi:hypothetical protein
MHLLGRFPLLRDFVGCGEPDQLGGERLDIHGFLPFVLLASGFSVGYAAKVCLYARTKQEIHGYPP